MVPTSHMGLWSPYNVASVRAESRENICARRSKQAGKAPHLVGSSQQPCAEHQLISLEMRRLELRGEAGSNSTQAGPSPGGRELAGLVWTQSLQSTEPGGL